MSAAPRVALYLRVSTDDQTCANQLPDVEERVRSRGYEVARVYAESVCGRDPARPKFSRMMQDAAAARFDKVLVWRFDRFGRDARHALSAFLQLDALGISVESVREAWLDTAGPLRLALVAFAAVLADMETAGKSERTKAGLARAAKKGKYPGRPAVPAGVLDAAEAAWRGGASMAAACRAQTYRQAPTAENPAGKARHPSAASLKLHLAKKGAPEAARWKVRGLRSGEGAGKA